MIYAIQARVFFRNATRRDNAILQLNTRYQSQQQYGQPVTNEITHPTTGDPGLESEARFRIKADRDALWADLDAAWGTGIQGPVADSEAWIHDCLHDEYLPCPEGPRRVWT